MPLDQTHRGPEGRPLNVSPARKGWVGISLSCERHRRGTRVLLNQSPPRGTGLCPGIRYDTHRKGPLNKPRTGLLSRISYARH
jgi:hypothetical protein